MEVFYALYINFHSFIHSFICNVCNQYELIIAVVLAREVAGVGGGGYLTISSSVAEATTVQVTRCQVELESFCLTN